MSQLQEAQAGLPVERNEQARGGAGARSQAEVFRSG